jgi:hypothetical protein
VEAPPLLGLHPEAAAIAARGKSKRSNLGMRDRSTRRR